MLPSTSHLVYAIVFAGALLLVFAVAAVFALVRVDERIPNFASSTPTNRIEFVVILLLFVASYVIQLTTQRFADKYQWIAVIPLAYVLGIRQIVHFFVKALNAASAFDSIIPSQYHGSVVSAGVATAVAVLLHSKLFAFAAYSAIALQLTMSELTNSSCSLKHCTSRVLGLAIFFASFITRCVYERVLSDAYHDHTDIHDNDALLFVSLGLFVAASALTVFTAASGWEQFSLAQITLQRNSSINLLDMSYTLMQMLFSMSTLVTLFFFVTAVIKINSPTYDLHLGIKSYHRDVYIVFFVCTLLWTTSSLVGAVYNSWFVAALKRS